LDLNLVINLLGGLLSLTWGNVVMMTIGGILIYLAIVKDYEPMLLLPIGVGTILANLPLTGMTAGIRELQLHQPLPEELGLFGILYQAGIHNELFPLLIFVGVGAMTDFGPLLENPKLALMGAAGQFGIFGAMLLALAVGFPLKEAATIGIIGAADGPTAIYVATVLAPSLMAPVTVAAYSYMSLVPILKPPVMRLLTTKAERRIKMPYTSRPISRTARILFPIVVTLVSALLVPLSAPLISMLMLGNLLRESRVVDRLSEAAQNELTNVVTIFLGLTVGATMGAESFLNWETIAIFLIGLVAFVLDTAAGLLFAKLMNLLAGGTINPLIGAAGISAFPMSARVVQRFVQEEDFSNFVLMPASLVRSWPVESSWLCWPDHLWLNKQKPPLTRRPPCAAGLPLVPQRGAFYWRSSVVLYLIKANKLIGSIFAIASNHLCLNIGQGRCCLGEMLKDGVVSGNDLLVCA
jgi:sodium ion-translocating decarboxylase beta subunit